MARLTRLCDRLGVSTRQGHGRDIVALIGLHQIEKVFAVLGFREKRKRPWCGEFLFAADALRGRLGDRQLVQEAQNSKAPAQRLADRAAFWLVLVALGAGTLTFLIWAGPVGRDVKDSLLFAIRTGGDPLALAGVARSAIAAVDPMQPVFEIMSERQVLGEKTISLQYIAGVMAIFAGLALLLAVLGLYAVMSYLVAQRVREIGVRIALGATQADVTRLTLSQAARLTGIGVAIGLVLAVALSRAMEAGLLGNLHVPGLVQ